MAFSNLFSIENEICVITGSGGALGGEIASFLAKEGAKVVLLDIVFEKVNELASKINEKGFFALPLECDVLNKESVKEALKVTLEQVGVPTALINAAGGNKAIGSTDCEFYQKGTKGKTFLDLSLEGFKETFDLNYYGTVIPTQVFSKPMVEASYGSIINFASVSSINPLTKVVAYSSAKAAVVNFTKWLATHYAKTNVRVNAIAPGFLMTEQLKFLHLDKEGNYTERAKSVINHTPMGRYREPNELVGSIVYLVSKASKFVTGSLITLDGGFSAYTI
jgi:NAD(P)-dependent dehydrogenase (short-subunit alcohol dehydrogenase family)